MFAPLSGTYDGGSVIFTTQPISRCRATPIVFRDSLSLPKDNIPGPIDPLVCGVTPDLMFFQEYVILPALHSEQDFAQQRKIVQVVRVDCDLSLGAKRKLVIVHFVADINLRGCATRR